MGPIGVRQSVAARRSEGRRRLLRGALVASTLVAAACGGPFQVESEQPLAEEISAPRGLLVMPVAAMSHKSGALEIGVRSSDVAGWLLDHTEVPILGPFDFKTLKEVDDANLPSTDTDLATRLDGDRIDLSGWWSVHVLVTENRAASSRNIVDTNAGDKGKTVSTIAGLESLLRLEVRVREATRGRTLAIVTMTTIDDPGKLRATGDPRPHIRLLIEAGLARTFADVLPRLQGNPQRRVRTVGTLPSIPGLMAQGFVNLPSLAEQVAEKSEVERETAMITAWERVWPNLPAAATMAASNHAGVLMMKARAPLEAYDVVVSVGGKPTLERYQLDRQLRACSPSCTARVVRGATTLEVPIVWAPLPRPEAD